MKFKQLLSQSWTSIRQWWAQRRAERQSDTKSQWMRFSFFRVFLYLGISATLIGTILTYTWLDTLGVFDITERDLLGITQYKPSDNSIVYDKDGEKIGEFFNRYHVYVPYEKIPRDFIRAVLAIEDKKFFRHIGVDVKGMIRAGWALVRTGKYKQGASTITQQLVKNFILSREKTMNRKAREIALAIKLETMLSKQRILELYCNTLFLGNGAYGIGAAAKRYFGKPINELKMHQFALIAGLFQSPSRYNPDRYPRRAKKRQKEVITAMFRAKMITRDQAIELLRAPMEYVPYESINDNLAPYFIDHVREQATQIMGDKIPENRGLRIYTTLDSRLQKAANASIKNADEIYKTAEKYLYRRGRRIKKKKMKSKEEQEKLPIEASLLSVDSHNGGVLAMVGGRDYALTKYNRTTQSIRSPGSSFKPIVYSLAMHHGRTWADQVYVTPVSVANYRPKNFGSSDYLTESTLLRSFYKSINSITIEIGKKLGLPKILNYARKLGIKSKLKDEPGTMIGGSDVTMFDLARVYSVFSSYGKKPHIHAITKITDRYGKVLYQRDYKKNKSERVISRAQAYLMVAGMQSVMRYGTAAKSGHHSRYAAGKTGTSNNAMDNWFCGFTRNMTTIVWLGTDDHSPLIGKATGGDLALPIWDAYHNLVRKHKMRKLGSFWRPGGVVRARVHAQYGHRSAAGIPMFFLPGKAPVETKSDFEMMSTSSQEFRNVFAH